MVENTDDITSQIKVYLSIESIRYHRLYESFAVNDRVHFDTFQEWTQGDVVVSMILLAYALNVYQPNERNHQVQLDDTAAVL